MKTLKSNGGSYGISIMNTNGTPYRATTDGFTSADNIDEFSVYLVSNDSSENTYVEGLPSESTAGKMYGTLITFPYKDSDSRASQVFIRYNTTSNSGIYVRHRFTGGHWLGWKLLEGTNVA